MLAPPLPRSAPPFHAPAWPRSAPADLFDDEEGEADEGAPAASGRKQPRGKQARKAGKQQQGRKQPQQKGRKPAARQRKATVASDDDDEWNVEAEVAEMSEMSSEELLGGTAGAVQRDEGQRVEGQAPAQQQARSSGSDDDYDDDLSDLRAARGAQAVAKAAALAAATQLPFRKRLKRFARAAAAAEGGSTTPAGSTGSRPRMGSATGASRAAATQSVASSTPGGAAATGGTAVSAPLIPKRSTAGSLATPSERSSMLKRRSEIDRRLDEMVNAAGRLRLVDGLVAVDSVWMYMVKRRGDF